MGDIVLQMYIYKLSWSLVLTSATYRYIYNYNVLPVAICCCLQTCYIDVMLLLMDYVICIPTFIVVATLVVLLHTQIALHYNVWPEAIEVRLI